MTDKLDLDELEQWVQRTTLNQHASTSIVRLIARVRELEAEVAMLRKGYGEEPLQDAKGAGDA